MNVLFVCTKNEIRSLTAEKIFQNRPGLKVRSVGTASDARRRISTADIKWANLIFVMENKHQEILQEKFKPELDAKKIVCLHIPDDYEFMDPELMRILEESLAEYVK